jgi:hypothetical protein
MSLLWTFRCSKDQQNGFGNEVLLEIMQLETAHLEYDDSAAGPLKALDAI